VNALVIYESMFGNTEAIARAVAEGMADRFDVSVADVRTLPRAFGMDVVVVGGPTHAFGMSRPTTRRDAVRQGASPEDVAEVGLREWLDTTPNLPGTSAAAFDTKIDKPMTGSASHKASRRLRRLGCRVLVPAASFHVSDIRGPLAEGERERARRWGETIAEAAFAAVHRV
jgi:flavodoxin